MHDLTLRDYQAADHEQIFLLLDSNDWEFHSGTKINRAEFDKRIEKAYYSKQGIRTLIIEQEAKLIGLVRLFDLGDTQESSETPLFDIRVDEKYRAKGVGTFAVKHLVRFVFDNYPKKQRIEATTRIDNIAMRRALEKCHFAKEAHYRECWPSKTGESLDAVGYGLLRRDWEAGACSRVDWAG